MKTKLLLVERGWSRADWIVFFLLTLPGAILYFNFARLIWLGLN